VNGTGLWWRRPSVRSVRRRSRWHRQAVATALAGGLLLVAGCADQDEPSGEQPPPLSAPLAACTPLSAVPAQMVEPPADTGGDSGKALPELTLTCLTDGGEPFPLADLRGPAVINVWATWCQPCRKELPVLQRYADQYADQVHVVGVATRSDEAAAVEWVRELQLQFPSLHDYDGELSGKLGLFAMPSTLLVDHTGQIRYVYQQVPFTDEHELAELVEQHLGVASGRVEG
jgi:thiol-disulfide isomerase/thioredoxin